MSETNDKAPSMEPNLGQVMLVDDDADQRTTLEMLLSGYDMTVIEAGSGEEALEKLSEGPPSLILLDFDMPGIDGLATLARIREQYSSEQLPVVMVSNRQDTDIIVNALDHGANDYVTKVTDPDILLARIRRHLIQKRLPNSDERPFGGKIGPYQLGAKVSEGAIFSFFKATDSRDQRPVGLTILRPGYRVDRERYESLEFCPHTLLADLLDVGTEPVDYLAYQWIEGTPLDSYLKQKTLSKAEVINMALTLAEALQVIHTTGRRHGELRPTSIKVTSEGLPQILEFGLAELLVKENSVTRTGEVAGHPSYLAPEELTAPEQVDSRTDLYAIGGILFTLVTGRHPYEGTMAEILHQVLHEKPVRPSTLRPDGDHSFDFLCGRLLSKEPSQRYQSCAEVVQKLRELSEEISG